MQDLDIRLFIRRKDSFLRGATVSLLSAAAVLLLTLGSGNAQEPNAIKLSSPEKDKGFSIMKSLSLRQSAKDTSKWSEKELSLQDLSNLLWAGFGINREDGKRTAASAMNAQDVDIYVVMKDGVYVYDAANNALNQVASGDHRSEIGRGGMQSFNYPIKILLTSEIAKFRAGTSELKTQWGAFESGLVAQNIMLFCSGMGLLSHPKAAVDSDGKIKSLLKLTDTQVLEIELDVGYPKQQ